MTNNNKTTLYICRTCKPDGFTGADEDLPGAVFSRGVKEVAGKRDVQGQVLLKTVDCLGVCKRPCTVSFTGEDKFTYVIGDLQCGRDEEAVVEFALSYGESETGITPWRSRPEVVRKGTVARIPPVGYAGPLVSEIEGE